MNKQNTSEPAKRRQIIAVIGDARVETGSKKDQLAQEIGKKLIGCGFRLVTGGLSGVMESASRGARSSENYCDGDIIGILPGHDPAEANPYVDIAIASGLDHLRNSIVAHSDAVIAIGGGAGTLSEISLAWIYRKLIIGLRVDGWSQKMADTRVDERIRYKDIPDDRVFGAVTADECMTLLAQRLPDYHKPYRGIGRKPLR